MKIIFKLFFTLNTFAFLFAEDAPKVDSSISQTLTFAKSHQEFRNLYFQENEQEFVRLVREGQSPQTLFIGCSDSRVVPDLILGTRPGDLFVVRTAGNLVIPFDQNECVDGVAASIQYGIEVLGTKHVIVCGHSHCGAIQGLFKTLDPKSLNFVAKWLKIAEPAKKMTLMTTNPSTPKETVYKIAEQISVVYQLENLLSYPFIKERVKNGSLVLHGWYFTIETGELEYYDPEQYKFVAMKEVLQAQKR